MATNKCCHYKNTYNDPRYDRTHQKLTRYVQIGRPLCRDMWRTALRISLMADYLLQTLSENTASISTHLKPMKNREVFLTICVLMHETTGHVQEDY
jgi:hypothetical protein